MAPTASRLSSNVWSVLTKLALVAIVIVWILFVTNAGDIKSNFEHSNSAVRFKAYHELLVKSQKQDHEFNEYSTTKVITLPSSSKTLIQSNSTKDQPMERKLNLTRDDLARLAPDIFHGVPPTYLENYRSFCWFQGDQLWCLPYFYIIGFHKCGTTDIFKKLEQHPSVLKVVKEPHWWAIRRARFQKKTFSPQSLISQVQREVSDISSIPWYLHWFKHQNVLNKIEHTTKNVTLENGETIIYHPYVFGDGSVSTLTNVIYNSWDKMMRNSKVDPDVLPYLLHALQPLARIIITVRDPVQRIKSMFGRKFRGGSAELHQYAVEAIECATDCMAKQSVRQCAYYSHCQRIPQIYLGIYIEFIRPWAMVYGKANLLILRMEERIQNPVGEFKKIVEYLDLETLSTEEYQNIMQTSVSNKNKRKVDMMNETKILLQNFYRPFNKQMAAFMNDDRYNFGY